MLTHETYTSDWERDTGVGLGVCLFMGVSPSCSAGILLSHVSVLSFQGLKIEACRKRTENGHLLPNNTGLAESSLPGRKALYLVVRMKAEAPPGGFTDPRAMVLYPWAQAGLRLP